MYENLGDIYIRIGCYMYDWCCNVDGLNGMMI